MKDAVWTEAMQARLRALWNDGLTAAAISVSMGISRNAVIGKAHRLGLPARPSPIRTCADGARPATPSKPPSKPPPIPPPVLASLTPAAQVVMRAPVPVAVAPAAPRPVQPHRVAACSWPIGDPRAKNFRFCEAVALPSCPYCGEHAQASYVTVRGRQP